MLSALSIYIVLEFEISETDSLFSDGHSALQQSIKCYKNVESFSFSIVGCNIKKTWRDDRSESFLENIDDDHLNFIKDSLDCPQTGASIEFDITEIHSLKKARKTFPRKSNDYIAYIKTMVWPFMK